LVQALVLKNQYTEALEVSERGRARSFVQLLSGRLAENAETPVLANSLSFADMQKVAAAQQSVLIEYSIVTVPDDMSLLYIWVMQPTGKLDFRQVPLGDDSARLSELVRQSRESIGVRGRGFVPPEPDLTETATTDKLRELHQLMIEPIADLLPSNPEQKVVFIPQGDLFLIPFPALINESGEHLIQQHTILTAPSIQVLDLTRRQATASADNASANLTQLLAVGNPVMPEVWNPEKATVTQLSSLMGAEREARAVADFFNTEALLGAEATEQVVKQQIGNARIVHLATHGLLEYGTPEESGVRDVPGAIALTPTQDEDGLLTSAEILELDLQADLVVLSACDTGLGTITGDGVIGLSRSLIAAGAPSVIVSLWSIPDAPTADLMTEFYRQRQQGKDKAQALRQAMLITMESHPNPVDWAAFTLIGAAE
jgi:CHAT domain-containing protein